MYEYEQLHNISVSYQMKHKLFSYGIPVLLLLGMVGNALVVLVLSRTCRQVSTYAYLFALALTDELVLLAFSKHWLVSFWQVSLETSSNFTCQTVHFVSSSSSMLSSWLTVTVTIERFLVVVKPLQARTFTKVKRAALIILAHIGIAMAVNAHFYFTLALTTFRVVSNDMNVTIKLCDFTGEYETEFAQMWAWVDGALYSYGPFCLLLPANLVIFVKITLAKRKRKSMTYRTVRGSWAPASPLGPTTGFHSSSSTSAQPHSPVTNCHFTTSKSEPPSLMIPRGSKMSPLISRTALVPIAVPRHCQTQRRTPQRTVMPLIVSGFFLITVFPVCVVKILLATVLQDAMSSNEFRPQLSLLSGVVDILMLTNHAGNFFLYCTLGAKFRQELRRLFASFTHLFDGDQMMGPGGGTGIGDLVQAAATPHNMRTRPSVTTTYNSELNMRMEDSVTESAAQPGVASPQRHKSPCSLKTRTNRSPLAAAYDMRIYKQRFH